MWRQEKFHSKDRIISKSKQLLTFSHLLHFKPRTHLSAPSTVPCLFNLFLKSSSFFAWFLFFNYPPLVTCTTSTFRSFDSCNAWTCSSKACEITPNFARPAHPSDSTLFLISTASAISDKLKNGQNRDFKNMRSYDKIRVRCRLVLTEETEGN